MAKFCYKCGNPIREGATFCGKCGSVIMHEPAAEDLPEQPEHAQVVSSVPVVQEPVPGQHAYQEPVQPTPVYQNTVYQEPVQPTPVYQNTVYQQPVQQQPIYQQAAYQQPVQTPVYPVTQQLAQQAYMAQMQSRNMMMAASLKPQRYIPLRVILILICAALLFCGWRWGIKNVKNAMREQSIIDEYPFDEGEDPSVVQARYDSLGSGAEEEEETQGYEPIHEIYDWFYRES